MRMNSVKLIRPAREGSTVDWNLVRVQNDLDYSRFDGFTLVMNVLTMQFTLMKRVCRLIQCADHSFKPK
jgi:hypothetical protein